MPKGEPRMLQVKEMFTLVRLNKRKKSTVLLAVCLISFAQTGIAFAGNVLKVAYAVEADFGDLNDDSYLYSETFPVGTSEAISAKKKITGLAKSSATKSKFMLACKANDSYNARVKVVDARGGTAGLSNLRSISVINVKVSENFADLPDYTEEEAALLDEEYFYYSDYPDFVEDGYVYYSIEATCLFSGTVSLISSNSYRIYINGSAGPEYSKSEFDKMKWSIRLVDI
jgi:hypothetical protein